jgi:acetyl esterase/lipase
LPASALFVAGADLLLGEGVRFGHRLLAAGVPTQLSICHGLPHGFMRGMFESATARSAVQRIADVLRACL